MNAPQRVFLRTLKQLRDNDEGDAARCLVTAIEENGETKTIRGCAFASDDIEEACNNAVANGMDYDGPLKMCRVCAADGCNSAVKSTIALVLLATGVFVNLYLIR
ncbi:hypothetical protein O0L34_g382 [Tuta absoluta]|nr:hypothetical protein O0L34_g382 [Tuta absoluta]